MSDPAPPAFKDRRAGLILFGILTIGIGCLCALFVPLMLWASMQASRHGGFPGMPAVLPGVVTYGFLGVALIWLGAGSILARRWARALLLIFSWAWLIVGVFSILTVLILLPGIRDSMNAGQGASASPGVQMTIFGIMAAFYFAIFLLLPGVWVFFYQSPHVKATCEARDSVPRWTDRCPLPVLAISLFAFSGAATMLFTAFAYRGFLPFFGTFLLGIPGGLLSLILAGIWIWAGMAAFRLNPAGWWILLLSMVLVAVSCFLTYLFHDFADIYRTMGLPDAEIARMNNHPFVRGRSLAWISLLSAIPWIGYLLWIQRYFKQPPTPA